MHSPLLITVEQQIIANVEEAIVYLNLQPDVGEEFPVVPFRFTVTALEEHTTYDAATVYLTMTPLGGECYSTYTGELLGEGEADGNWFSSLDEYRWFGTELTRWSEGDIVVEGINC